MVMLVLVEMLDLGLLEDGWREPARDEEVDCLSDLLLFGIDAIRSLLKKLCLSPEKIGSSDIAVVSDLL